MTAAAQNPVLIELTADMKDKFLEMAEDYRRAGEDRYQAAFDDFDAFFERIELYRTGENLPEGHVRSNYFVLLDDEKLVGSGSLRYELNAGLTVYGGHIGYAVRPSDRQKGYGTLILRLLLEKARLLGLEKVFLTCDSDNVASAKIIEKGGGRLENQIFYEPTGKLISQYWIDL
jgi:predicted acetyltransferase